MQWMVRLEARAGAGEASAAEMSMFDRPGVVSRLAETSLALSKAEALLTKLRASVLRAKWRRLRPTTKFVRRAGFRSR